MGTGVMCSVQLLGVQTLLPAKTYLRIPELLSVLTSEL